MVLFGASGDLARRKILPALYNLAHDALLPERFAVVGYARSDGDDASFRDQARDAVRQFSRRPLDEERWRRFARLLFYVPGSYDDPGGFGALHERLARVDEQDGTGGRRLYYCATPPAVFPTIVRRLDESGPHPDARIVLEKPIGRDLTSARSLQDGVRAVFDERQVFRIDHYLGKETVQNILVFRFANPLIEQIWDRQAIDHVQVTVAEPIGLEGRGSYYDNAGALRDMVQNHLLQVLSLLTMERPGSLADEAIRDAKSMLLGTVRPLAPEDVVRGQYTWGVVEGHEAPAYRDEPGVAGSSTTETYAAVRAWVDNERWGGVPFLLRAGKRLPRRTTEVVAQLRDTSTLEQLFTETGAERRCNSVALQLQPEPGITVDFRAKQPGHGVSVQTVSMHFSYGAAFMVEPPEAYERLIADAMAGDRTLFVREDEVERAWEIVAPVLEVPGPAFPYPAGTWGPSAADGLLPPGRKWHLR